MDIIKKSIFGIISSVVRYLMVSGITWLTTHEFIDTSTSTQLVAIAPVVVAATIWSVIERYVIAKVNLAKILTALDLAPGSTLEHLNEAMKAGGKIEDTK